MNVSGSGPVLYVNLVAYTSSVQGGDQTRFTLVSFQNVLASCQLWGDGPEKLREMKKWRLGAGPGIGVYMYIDHRYGK